jgi:hypothetical protein
LIGPQLFGLSPDNEPPNPRNARTLTLISKTIQQLANMCPFDGKKEPYMAQLNHLVESNVQRMKKFVDEISVAPSDTELSTLSRKKEGGFKGFARIFSAFKSDKSDKKDVDIERYLGMLHRYVVRISEKLTVSHLDHEKEDIAKLQAILSEMMEVYHKKTLQIQTEREAALKKLELESDISSSFSSALNKSSNSLARLKVGPEEKGTIDRNQASPRSSRG